MTQLNSALTSLLFLAGLALVACLYFLPTIVGHRKQNVGAIFVLNLLLGWTLLGWVGAMVWACTKDPQHPRYPSA